MPDETQQKTTSAPLAVVDLPSVTGEGPLWNQQQRTVYWVDIPPGRLYCFDPDTNENSVVYQHSAAIGGYTFQADGAILLFCARGEILRWHDDEVTTVVDGIAGEEDGRFNDVIAGPDGHVYCGTMPTAGGRARLYRLELDGSLTTLFDDIGLSNGFGFSPDNRILYHTDTSSRVIYSLDYEPGTGTIGNRQVLVQVPEGEGAPDGMATDAEGTIWSARWDGSAIYRYSAQGEPQGTVPFPVRKVSSLTFGGDDLGTAYVTTAGGNNRGETEGVLAGSLFRIDLGVKGRPAFLSRIGL
jgi:D-xylonolactonase